jgi:hypothetical protein
MYEKKAKRETGENFENFIKLGEACRRCWPHHRVEDNQNESYLS